MKKIILCAFALLLASCAAEPTIVGSWVEPNPIAPDQVQGIELKEGGIAQSINMASLQYKTWEKIDNKLVLSGLSIGNHVEIAFCDTLTIELLSKDSLKATCPVFSIAYGRQK